MTDNQSPTTSTVNGRVAAIVENQLRFSKYANKQLTKLLGEGRVVVAATPDEAIVAYLEHHPSLILMDQDLEDPKQGSDVTAEIRALDSDNTVIIIALTSSVRDIDSAAFKAAGADGLLAKGVWVEVLGECGDDLAAIVDGVAPSPKFLGYLQWHSDRLATLGG